MIFHAPGQTWPQSSFMAWSRGTPGDTGPIFKWRYQRYQPKPRISPTYTQSFDEGLEVGADGNLSRTFFVEGVKCHDWNWDMSLYGSLEVVDEPKQVHGAECKTVLATRDPEKGNLTFCLGDGGVPLELDVSLLASFSGGSNAGFYTMSATFQNFTSGPLPEDTFTPPAACTDPPPPAKCPYNVSEPTETITAVHFTHAAGKNCGLNNLMTNDLRGAITFGGGDYEFLQVYNVSVHKGFAPIQDCNYNPKIGQMVCAGGDRTVANAKSVGRCSEGYLEGKYQGQCLDNELIGSWYSFPSEGECAPGWDVGFKGCTWKTISFKVVSHQCVKERCGALQQDLAPYLRLMPCAERALGECPDLKGPMGPTCFSRPDVDADILV